jgi:hypothetical protein
MPSLPAFDTAMGRLGYSSNTVGAFGLPVIRTVGGFPILGKTAMRMLYRCSVANISLPCYGFDTEDVGFFICDEVDAYHPRNPEDHPLYGVVSEHLETFLSRQRERERPVPHFVERELRAFLDCGVLAHGIDGTACSACASAEIQYHKILWRAGARIDLQAIDCSQR